MAAKVFTNSAGETRLVRNASQEVQAVWDGFKETEQEVEVQTEAPKPSAPKQQKALEPKPSDPSNQ